MTGEAPPKGLRKVFRAFSKFLKKIHCVISAILEAELNSESKAIFDQLFISQEQIEEAKMLAHMYDLFCSFSAAAEDEFMAEYQRLVGERDDAAEEHLRARLLKDLARRDRFKLREFKRLNKQGAEARTKIRNEEIDAFNKSRVGQAMAKIKTDSANVGKGRILGGEEALKYQNRIGITDGTHLAVLNRYRHENPVMEAGLQRPLSPQGLTISQSEKRTF